MGIEQQPLFSEEDWAQLPSFFEQLPRPIEIHLWAEPAASTAEQEAERLLALLSDRFKTISYRRFPRRINYAYYPVMGVMDAADSEGIRDVGVRLIGLPVGHQMTALIAAIQSVSFQGMTSEAKTRVMLHRLPIDLNLELITTAEDEMGPVVGQFIFNMAAASERVRSFLIMGDAFPEALHRYSVKYVPHVVINGRDHLSGGIEEDTLTDKIIQYVRRLQAKTEEEE